MSIGHILFFHQLVFDKFQTAAVRIVGQREIADTVKVSFASKRILAKFHIGIPQEHAGATTTPQKRFLGRVNKGINRFVPLFLFKKDKTDTELRPLTFHVVLKAFMGESPITDNRAIVIFFLFVLKALHPKIIRVFLTELACILQGGIHLADFLFIT